jgi:uncharacterized membrane protein (UPF0127 family)
MLRLAFITVFSLLLASCGGDDSQSVKAFNTRPVTLPDGTVVRAEVMTNRIDMARGMMFRDSLPEGEGMLFIHGTPNKFSYWMYQVKIPLDIIWMDARGTVVEMSENTPPCPSKSASECPNFGGNKDSLVVLELPGGYARKHGVVLGQTIRF